MEDIIKPIVAPELETSNYGESINDQFVNIDNNFKLIANRDFVKGDSGESLYIENIKITKDGERIEGKLYEALKTAIKETFDSESKGTLKSVDVYNWDDSITSGELNAPIIASKDKTTNTVEYICAASPVMLFDNRFNKDAIENVNFSNYEDVVDVTSILNFKKDGDGNWECELNLSYPRLQYKNGSFCWVINNENTIVKSTGIKGDPGESANIWIVQTPVLPDAYSDTPINITKYFVGNEWVDEVPKNIKDGDLAIVYCESEEKDYYGFFVSQIKIDGANKTVVYNPKANIQNINYIKNTTEFFKSLGKGDTARGMFLKFDPGSSASTKSHIFYNEGENLYIKPTNNYSSLESYTGAEQPSINIAGYNALNISSHTTLEDNLTFLSGSNGNEHQIIVNGDSIGNGTTGSELTVWASNIHLTGNKDNLDNIITLGNGGMNKSGNSKVDINGDLRIYPIGKNNGDLTITNGDLTVSKGDLTVSKGDLSTDKNVNIKNNINFLSGSNENKHQIIVNGSPISVTDSDGNIMTDSDGNIISTTTGTTDSELTVWASNIHLTGNKDNLDNIITLGNGGMNKNSRSNVNIQGDLYVKPTGNNNGDLTITKGDLTVSKGDLNIIDGVLKVKNKIDMNGVSIEKQGDGSLKIASNGIISTGNLTVKNDKYIWQFNDTGIQFGDENGLQSARIFTNGNAGIVVKSNGFYASNIYATNDIGTGGITANKITADEITANKITADEITVSGDIDVSRHIKISKLGNWSTPAKTITIKRDDANTHSQYINYNDILTGSGYGVIKLNGNGMYEGGEVYQLIITDVPSYSLLHFGISAYNADTANQWDNMNIYIGSHSSKNQIHDFDVPASSTIKKEFFVLTGKGGEPLWHNGNIDMYKSYYT